MADEDLNAPAAAESAEPAVANDAPASGQPEASTDESIEALYDSILSRDGADPAAEAAKAEPEAPAADQESGQPQKAEGEQVDPAIAAPQSWPAEMKSKWDAIPPDVRPYIAQRELEAHQQITRMGQEIARFKPIGELVDARMEVFDRHGVAPQQGIDLMLRMQDLLDRDPRQGIQAIAQSMGIDLAAMFGANASADGQQLPPEVAQLSEQVRQLQHQLSLRDNTERVNQTRNDERRRAEVKASVDAWGKDKPHYGREDIRKAMGSLIGAGLAADLDSAYDQACNANPEVRALVAAEAKKAEEAKRLAEQSKAVADAKRSKAVNLGRRAGTPASGARWDDERELGSLYDSIAAA